MTEIPEALIKTAEKLSDEGPIRADDASEETHLLHRMGIAEIVKMLGPEPPQPQQSIEQAHDLRVGELIGLRDAVGRWMSCVGCAPVGHIPYPSILVKLAGSLDPLSYGVN